MMTTAFGLIGIVMTNFHQFVVRFLVQRLSKGRGFQKSNISFKHKAMSKGKEDTTAGTPSTTPTITTETTFITESTTIGMHFSY